MKKDNLIFIITCILLVLFIISLNYFVDPFSLFGKDRPLQIHRKIRDKPEIPIKLHKNSKYKYVIVGGSTVSVLKLYNYNKDLADISIYKLNNNGDMDYLLNYFLEMHPEVETVFLSLNYRQITKKTNDKILQSNTKNLTLQELYEIFLSHNAIINSIKKIFNRKITYSNETIATTNQIIDSNVSLSLDESFKTYDNLIDDLKKKNIKVVCFIQPTHAVSIAYLDDIVGYNRLVHFKKHIINKADFIIDMSLLNKYTTLPLEDTFYLFIDAIHPTDIYGYFVYNILFDTSKKDKDLYKILTRENINDISREDEKKLRHWKKLNKNSYKNYFIADDLFNRKKYTKVHYLEEVPLEFRNILNYKKPILQKFTKLHNTK